MVLEVHNKTWYNIELQIANKVRVAEDRNIKDLNFGIKKPPLKSGPKGNIAVIYVFRFTCAVRRVYFYKNVNDLLFRLCISVT